MATVWLLLLHFTRISLEAGNLTASRDGIKKLTGQGLQGNYWAAVGLAVKCGQPWPIDSWARNMILPTLIGTTFCRVHWVWKFYSFSTQVVEDTTCLSRALSLYSVTHTNICPSLSGMTWQCWIDLTAVSYCVCSTVSGMPRGGVVWSVIVRHQSGQCVQQSSLAGSRDWDGWSVWVR